MTTDPDGFMKSGLHVTHHASAAALLERARDTLEVAEAENGLLLGILAAPPPVVERGDAALWMSVDAGPACEGVALRTPPHNLLLSRTSPAPLEALVHELAARATREEIALPGVSGPRETAHTFADSWARATGATSATTMRQGLYELTRVIMPLALPPGALRVARPDEADQLAEWMTGFARDAQLPLSEHATLRRSVAARIAAGALFVWDDAGEARSMAALQGRTRRGIRVSMVYTPVELRGRGYATACVAAVSALALASGRRFCTLYTDLTNPTSNAIYQRVGYRLIGESAMIAFASAASAPCRANTEA